MRRAVFSFAGILMALLCSCSVKENRSGCPGCLILDFESVNHEVIDSLVVDIRSQGECVLRKTLFSPEFAPDCMFSVPRTALDVQVYSGDDGLLGPDGMRIPRGEQCPPIFLYNENVNFSGELAQRKVEVSKEFSEVRVAVNIEGREYETGGVDGPDGHDGMIGPDGDTDMLLEISGGIAGFDGDFCPAEGDFCVRTPLVDGCSVRVPRQRDDTLSLIVYHKGRTIVDFPLGQHLASIGFDWTATSLADISISFDIVDSRAVVILTLWDNICSFSVTI